MSLSLHTPAEIALTLADRVRERRLARGWTQTDLADRAGLALATLKLFEHTGQISLDRLLRVASVFGELEAFLGLFEPRPARTLDELEAQTAGPGRKYGRRHPRGQPAPTPPPVPTAARAERARPRPGDDGHGAP